MAVVSIFDDNVVEDTKFINLTLTSEDSAVMFSPATARIYIEDVDSELTVETLSLLCPPSMHLDGTE